jgi:hypothetical protein
MDALLLERKIDLSALLRKNRMLEIIGVDCSALREQLFLAEGLSTKQLEARILEGTERLDFERAQDTYRASQVGNSDAASSIILQLAARQGTLSELFPDLGESSPLTRTGTSSRPTS